MKFGWILLFVLPSMLVVGCTVFQPAYEFRNAENWLPEKYLKIYQQLPQAHFDGIDSLQLFIQANRKFSALQEVVEQYEIEKKHMPDFALAYDGDTAAYNRLLRQMILSNNTQEMLLLFFGLCQIDTVQPIAELKIKLNKLSGKTHSMLQDALIKQSNTNRWNIDRVHENDSLSAARVYHQDEYTDEQVAQTIVKATKNNFEWLDSLAVRMEADSLNKTCEILGYAMLFGTSEQYCSARDIAEHIAQIGKLPEFVRRRALPTQILMIPQDGDTINTSSDVKDIIETISDKIDCNTISSSPSSIRAIVFKDSAIIHSICQGSFVLTSDKEAIHLANNIGLIELTELQIQTCNNYASVSYGKTRLQPYWKSLLSVEYEKLGLAPRYHCDVTRFFFMKKNAGVWTKFGFDIFSLIE